MRNTGKLEIFEKENNEWKLKHIENFPNYFNKNGTTSTSDSRNRYNVSINNNYIVCGRVSSIIFMVLITSRMLILDKFRLSITVDTLNVEL